jgi:hypothetical protein
MYQDNMDLSSANASVWRAVLANTCDTLPSMSSYQLSMAAMRADA